MKLKLIAPLLMSLIAMPAFAHGNHDDEDTSKVATPPPQVGATTEAQKAAQPAAPSDKTSTESQSAWPKPAAKKP